MLGQLFCIPCRLAALHGAVVALDDQPVVVTVGAVGISLLVGVIGVVFVAFHEKGELVGLAGGRRLEAELLGHWGVSGGELVSLAGVEVRSLLWGLRVRIVNSGVCQSVAFLRAGALAHDVYVFGVPRAVVAYQPHLKSDVFSYLVQKSKKNLLTKNGHMGPQMYIY